MMENKRPVIGITMGDPSGIGPEITVKSLMKKEIYDICRPLVVGDKEIMMHTLGIAKKDLKINAIKDVSEAKFEHGVIDVLDLNNVDVEKLEHGVVRAEYGRAAGDYIAKVIQLALDKKVDATVTNPIHKEAFKFGGYGEKYPGHTEMFADLTNTTNYSMMLSHGEFRVVHVSTHVSLKQACEMVKKDAVLRTIKLAHNICRSLGIEKPRIVVAGLNPHSGEGGLFGTEEKEEIEPAIKMAQEMEINAEGPVPPDTAFAKANGGMYDIAVAMYHDQGHIPMKVVGFQWDEKHGKWKSVKGVNSTLGLPIIRTSVDHGVAFGKAGKGTASPDSLMDAINVAIKMANSKGVKK